MWGHVQLPHLCLWSTSGQFAEASVTHSHNINGDSIPLSVLIMSVCGSMHHRSGTGSLVLLILFDATDARSVIRLWLCVLTPTHTSDIAPQGKPWCQSHTAFPALRDSGVATQLHIMSCFYPVPNCCGEWLIQNDDFYALTRFEAGLVNR